MKPERSITYRPDIDGLRAIAVLLVIAFHSSPYLLKSGFIGVDIFFVISGYLISGIILKSLNNNQFSYIEFYKRRIKRIFPALIPVLATCLIAGVFFLFSGEYMSLGKHVASGAGFLSNIFYWLESGYFDVSATLKPLLHLWSLGVEEQFYIFWPILLVFFYKRVKRVPLTTSILLVLSFLLAIYMGTKSPEAAFYLPITRFWELMSGAILAQITLSNEDFLSKILSKCKFNISDKDKKFIRNALSVIGLLLLIEALLIISEENFYKGFVILCIIGTFLIIAAGQEAWINKKILSNKMLVFIGLISYPLYLWHWPLLSFANIITFGSTSTSLRLTLILTSFILAWGTYELIEKPVRHSKIKKIPQILCMILLIVGLLGATVYLNQGFDSRFPTQEAMLKSISISADSTKAMPYTGKLDSGQSLCKKMYPLKIQGLTCWASGNGTNKVFIIGDSHARAIYIGYSQSLAEKGYTVIDLSINGCELLTSNLTNTPKYAFCNENIKKLIDLVVSENPRAVIISNNAWYTKRSLFEQGMNETLSYFSKNTNVLWFLQTPRIKRNLAECVGRPMFSKNYSENCYFPREEFDRVMSGQKEKVFSLKKLYPQLITIDPFEVLCNSSDCAIMLNKTFIYEDNLFHLSIFGSHYLADKMPIDKYFPVIEPTNVTVQINQTQSMKSLSFRNTLKEIFNALTTRIKSAF